MKFEVALEGLSAGDRAELREHLQARAVAMARAAECEIAAIGRENQEGARPIEGVGAVRLRLHPMQRLVDQVVHGADPLDPETAKWQERRHEYARVRYARKPMVNGGREYLVADGAEEGWRRVGRKLVKSYGRKLIANNQ